MKIIKYPNKSEYKVILTRPTQDISVIEERVLPILKKVKAEGDSAIREYALQFDHVILEALAVAEIDIQNAGNQLSDDLKTAIKQAYANIYKFHEAQKSVPEKIETMVGVTCWRKSVGIDKVGLYVPGGTAPLFSTVLPIKSAH